MQSVSQYLFPILIIGLVLYRRIKRSVGFQLLKLSRLKFRIFIFILVSVLILAMSALQPISYIYDVIGMAIGLILAKLAIKYSLFETRNSELFFRTNIWIESLTLFLFLSRFLYRLMTVYMVSKPATTQDPTMISQNFTRDPLTRIFFFILAIYYIGYYAFLLKKGKELAEEKSRDITI